MNAYPLARLLADGVFRSSAELAASLSMETGLIPPLLEELRAVGLPVHSDAQGRIGLAHSLELLATDKVLLELTPEARALLRELDLHPTIDSTNAEAMRRLDIAACPGLVVTAEQQSAGRGRRGRRWVSPFGSNLYLSCVWQFQRGVDALEGLSLAVGVAVAEALEAAGIEGVALKWPNDILHDGAKMGGILIETSGSASGAVSAVVGIGINLRMPAGGLDDIDQPWTDAATVGVPVARNALLAGLLNRLLPLLAGFEDQGFAAWRERWLARNAFAARDVTVLRGGERIAGRMSGVSQTGMLQLEVAGALMEFDGGEVSLRVSS